MFTPRAEQSAEEKAYRKWVYEHRHSLIGHDIHDIVLFSLYNQFSSDTIYSVLSCFHDALGGWDTDKRFEAEFVRLCLTIEMMKPKELDLMPLWQDLHAYQTGEGA